MLVPASALSDLLYNISTYHSAGTVVAKDTRDQGSTKQAGSLILQMLGKYEILESRVIVTICNE